MELTRFEKAVGIMLGTDDEDCIKSQSSALLSIAKEELMKDLPKWRKDNPSATTLYVKYNGYYLEMDKITKLFDALPKEE